ncbi:MAG: nitrite/sulfite reductase [bacterium]|nr:nitrite/sulfite reductase [bacterium]
MKINYADKFRNDLVEFRETTSKFYNGEMKMHDYKGFSGGFGTYAQRGGKLGMLRLRHCGGRITKEYLDFIVESINKYQIDLIHITTCQCVQLHNLTVDVINALIEEAWDHGIITRGGGGDYPRNVMVSPLTGVDPNEPFNLTPYAEAASDYLLQFIGVVKLPRKLKVCFSNNPDNWPHATFRDLGFVANSNHTFDVYSAGGLGNNPKMGVLVASNVDPKDILYHIKAMIVTFTTYGNYEQRAKARTRYMQDTLGVEGYKEAYHEKLKEVMESEDLTLTVEPIEYTKTGDEENFTHPRVIKQKQKGLYTVFYHPIGGNPSREKLCELHKAFEKMEDVELRCTPSQGIFIINLTAAEAKEILELTNDGANNQFERSVACIGNHICQIGLRDSQALIESCVNAVRPYNFKDGVLPIIHISGCTSSCSAHQIGTLGFRGGVKKTDEGAKPAFVFYVGGCDLLGKERFGIEYGEMEIHQIPNFFIELGQTISNADSTYDEWIKSHHDDLIAIAKKYM